MKVKVHLSDKARREYVVRTGNELKAIHTAEIDLEQMTPEQRERVINIFGVPLVFCENTGWEYSRYAVDIIPDDVNSIMAMVSQLEQYNVKRLAEQAERKAQAAAAELKRRQEFDQRCITFLDEFEAFSDDHLYSVRRDRGKILGYSDPRCWESHDPEIVARYHELRDKAEALFEARWPAEHAANRAREKEEEEAKEREKAAMIQERLDWINANGSDFLKRAVAVGYDCQRRYVTERAAIDHPGAVVDFEGHADWKNRSCPSEAAFELAEEVSGTVVWLTDEPRATKIDEYAYPEPFEEQEAVVVSNYLGKYVVVYMM